MLGRLLGVFSIIAEGSFFDMVMWRPGELGNRALVKASHQRLSGHGWARILVLLTDAFGSLGGIAQFNRDLLQALCVGPGEVVGVPRLMPEPGGDLPPRLRYVTAALGSKRRYLLSVLRLLWENRQFDLTICGHINLLPIGALARAVTGSSLLLVAHGVEAWEPTARRVVAPFLRRVDFLLAVSDVTRRRFLKWSRIDVAKSFVLPNCVDARRFTPGSKDSTLAARHQLNGKVVIMTLGRLSASERLKGVDEVIELLPDLRRQVPQLVYLIVGDGSDRCRLEAKARIRGLGDRVVFAGRVSEAEKPAYYRLADAFVMPGRGEGFGIVYLEAMACGAPVVASKVDGSREAVRDGALGVLVDPDDPRDIKAGILEALRRPKGVVPAGLEYFSKANFERRCHAMLSDVLGADGRWRRSGRLVRHLGELRRAG